VATTRAVSKELPIEPYQGVSNGSSFLVVFGDRCIPGLEIVDICQGGRDAKHLLIVLQLCGDRYSQYAGFFFSTSHIEVLRWGADNCRNRGWRGRRRLGRGALRATFDGAQSRHQLLLILRIGRFCVARSLLGRFLLHAEYGFVTLRFQIGQ